MMVLVGLIRGLEGREGSIIAVLRVSYVKSIFVGLDFSIRMQSRGIMFFFYFFLLS